MRVLVPAGQWRRFALGSRPWLPEDITAVVDDVRVRSCEAT